MNYQEEQKRLQEGGSYWKPKVGQYKVKSLTELEQTDSFKRKGKDKDGKETIEEQPQFKVKILVNGENKVWTFGKGATPASTYGQLVDLATKKNNTLLDAEFTVVVKSDGTKNDYTIIA